MGVLKAIFPVKGSSAKSSFRRPSNLNSSLMSHTKLSPCITYTNQLHTEYEKFQTNNELKTPVNRQTFKS